MDSNDLNEKQLEQLIVKYSKQYYEGESDISDEKFDKLVENLNKLNPNSKILSMREVHSNDWNYKLENLPNKLYSIKKVKTFNEIQNWIKFVANKTNTKNLGEIELILTPKYDGIKLLHYNNNYYTRYEDGEQGYNVTERIKNNLDYFLDLNVEGELIISKSNFKKYFKNYLSSRNLIPAIFSSETRLKNDNKVEYIKYTIYDHNNINKEEQINRCNIYNKIQVPYLKLRYSELTEQKIIDFYFNNLSDYEYDGVVIDINDEQLRYKLDGTQKYLDYCRAYKGDTLFNDIKESKINNIIWQISRYGKLTPVANIDSVLINEGVVKNVSLYNASYVRDNNIHIGQNIKVTRRGKINPKIVEFLSQGKSDLPKYCPFCGGKLNWNESKVDLICNNENCIEKEIQKAYYFFKTIGFGEIGLETIKSIFINGKLSFFEIFEKENINSLNIEGLGQITKNTIINQLNSLRENGIDLDVLQEASSIFNGIARNTFKLLNEKNVDIEYLYNDSYYNTIKEKLCNIEGIGELIAEEYLYNLENFWKFYEKISKFVKIKQKIKQKIEEKIFDYKVVFTLFRDNDLQKFIENKGGKVLSSISSNCDFLIVKDYNSTSSKIEKAKQLNIKILSLEDFKKVIRY